VLGWSQTNDLETAIENTAQTSVEINTKLTQMGIDEIVADPALKAHSLKMGESLFGDNCAVCHGNDAQGGDGYPNLTDKV
jgi:cytochrome c oxidase cbb3-type subunit 3